MQQYTYLAIVLASVFMPLLYSFHPKMRFIRWWKVILIAITLTAIPFLFWDILFTKNSIWGFNPAYHLPVKLFSLPLEEWLFFWTIPFASIFTHYSLRYYVPNFKLSVRLTQIIGVLLLLIAVVLVFINYSKAYTFVNFTAFAVLMIFGLRFNLKDLQTFIPSFVVILFPFLIVNGILTGSFGFDTIVWYDNTENLGKRIFNIPLEDFAYAFTMLFNSIIIIEKIKPITWTTKNS